MLELVQLGFSNQQDSKYNFNWKCFTFMHEDKKPFLADETSIIDYVKFRAYIRSLFTRVEALLGGHLWSHSMVVKGTPFYITWNLISHFRGGMPYLMSINKVKCSPSSNTTKITLLHINSFLKKENSTSSEFVNASKPCGIVTLEIAMKRFQWNSRVSSVCFWFQSILT